MKLNGKINKTICLIVALVLLPLSVMASSDLETYRVKFEGPDLPRVQARTLSLWKILNEDGLGQEDLARIRTSDKESFESKLGDLDSIKLGEYPVQSEDFSYNMDLEEGYYIVFDELWTEDGQYHVGIMAFSLPEHKDQAIKSKLEGLDRPGRLKVLKLDEGGQALMGVGFKLLYGPDNVRGREGEALPLKKEGDTYIYDPSYNHDIILYTNKDGIIEIKDLPAGNYILKEVKPLEGYDLGDPNNPIVIRYGELTEITIVNRKDDGLTHFIKLDSDSKNPLPAASFIVMKKVDGKYERVQKDGQDYIVESGIDGSFSVSGLEKGTYYLWEISSPPGYRLLSEPFEFDIGAGTYDLLWQIENKKGLPPPEDPDNPEDPEPGDPEDPTPDPVEPDPKDPVPVDPDDPQPKDPKDPKPDPPPTGRIPKTGDISLIVMSIGGLLMILLGLYLVKEGKKEEGQEI